MKTGSVCRWVVCCLAMLVLGVAAEGRAAGEGGPATVLVGETAITLPGIDGFPRLDGRNREIEESDPIMASTPENRKLAIYGMPADVQRLSKDKKPWLLRMASIVVGTEFEDGVIPNAVFASFQRDRRKAIEAGARLSDGPLEKIEASRPDVQTRKSALLRLFQSERSVSLGVYDETEQSISSSDLWRYEVGEGGEESYIFQASSTCMAHVAGKLLAITVRSVYDSYEDLKWTRQMALELRDRLIAANPAGAAGSASPVAPSASDMPTPGRAAGDASAPDAAGGRTFTVEGCEIVLPEDVRRFFLLSGLLPKFDAWVAKSFGGGNELTFAVYGDLSDLKSLANNQELKAERTMSLSMTKNLQWAAETKDSFSYLKNDFRKKVDDGTRRFPDAGRTIETAEPGSRAWRDAVAEVIRSGDEHVALGVYDETEQSISYWGIVVFDRKMREGSVGVCVRTLLRLNGRLFTINTVLPFRSRSDLVWARSVPPALCEKMIAANSGRTVSPKAVAADKAPSTGRAGDGGGAEAVTLGHRKIYLPGVDGFPRMDGRSEELDAHIFSTLNQGDLRVVAFYAPESDLRLLGSGEPPELKRSISIMSFRSQEGGNVPPDEWPSLKDAMRETMTTGDVDDVKSDAERDIREAFTSGRMNRMDDLSPAFRFGDVVLLGVCDETEQAIAHTMIVRVQLKTDSGAAVARANVTSVCVVYLDGTMLSVCATAPFESDKDIKWTQARVLEVRDKLIAANSGRAVRQKAPAEPEASASPEVPAVPEIVAVDRLPSMDGVSSTGGASGAGDEHGGRTVMIGVKPLILPDLDGLYRVDGTDARYDEEVAKRTDAEGRRVLAMFAETSDPTLLQEKYAATGARYIVLDMGSYLENKNVSPEQFRLLKEDVKSAPEAPAASIKSLATVIETSWPGSREWRDAVSRVLGADHRAELGFWNETNESISMWEVWNDRDGEAEGVDDVMVGVTTMMYLNGKVFTIKVRSPFRSQGDLRWARAAALELRDKLLAANAGGAAASPGR